MVQGVARGVQAEALEDGLLPVDGEMVSKFGDDECIYKFQFVLGAAVACSNAECSKFLPD